MTVLTNLDGYEIDIVVQGYPGKSVCHGGLGWSTIVLMRGNGRNILVDVGGFPHRSILKARLAERGLVPKDVTDVLLTHAHHDHTINWPLFRHANIYMGSEEMAWALQQPWGESQVPEFTIEKLDTWPTFKQVRDGEEVLPGITAHLAPGHTPGCLVFVFHGKERDIVFSGDAAKNRVEMLTRKTDLAHDPGAMAGSFEMIWDFWRKRPGSILVPGHDLPMLQDNGNITYIGKLQAAVRSWFGDTLEQTTLIELTVE